MIFYVIFYLYILSTSHGKKIIAKSYFSEDVGGAKNRPSKYLVGRIFPLLRIWNKKSKDIFKLDACRYGVTQEI